MFRSLDCMHLEWKNCPKAWHGQFIDKDGNKSIILNSICDQSLWIWHANFGMSRSNNDINVLDSSSIMNDYLAGESKDMTFKVNNKYLQRLLFEYLLTDSIYPPWSIFVQTIHQPQDQKKKHFARMKESARKDMERCFGVLQIK